MMWTEIFPTTDKDGPAKKYGSGMISFKTDNKENCLFVVGGYYEKSPHNKQPGAQYTDIRTNESHIFNITTSEYIYIIPSYYHINNYKLSYNVYTKQHNQISLEQILCDVYYDSNLDN